MSESTTQMVQMRTTNRSWHGETFQTPGGTYLVQPNGVLIRVGQVRQPGGGARWSKGRNQPGVTPTDAAFLLDQPGGKRNWQVEKGAVLPPAPVEVKATPSADTSAIVAELDRRRAHLDGRAAALDERETRLHETHDALERRSADLDEREAGLLRRERNAGFTNEPTGTAGEPEGDNPPVVPANTDGGVEDPKKAAPGNLVELPPEAPQPLADGTQGNPSEEEGEIDVLAAEREANAEPAVEFEPVPAPPKKSRGAAPTSDAELDKPDLDMLGGSIPEIAAELASGRHDGFLMALTNAETQGKARTGALDALDKRRKEVVKAARAASAS